MGAPEQARARPRSAFQSFVLVGLVGFLGIYGFCCLGMRGVGRVGRARPRRAFQSFSFFFRSLRILGYLVVLHLFILSFFKGLGF